MKKVKVIVNPISGLGAGEKAIPDIQEKLDALGVSYDLVRTEKPWHAAELAERAVMDGYEIIASAGGDGTSNEVLNGIMAAKAKGKSATMAALTVGRGNDFAFGVNIAHDLDTDCKLLAEGHSKTIDVGFVRGGLFPDGRYFGNGVGIGFDAVVGFEALKMKRLSGFLCYLVAALKTIFLYFHAPLVRLEYNGEKLELPALMVSIMNGRRMGGGFMMAPFAQVDDGLLNLCIAKEVSRLKIFGLIGRFTKGDQETHKAIMTAQTKSIRVTALEGVLPAHADGETLCIEGKELFVELKSGQLDIIC